VFQNQFDNFFFLFKQHDTYPSNLTNSTIENPAGNISTYRRPGPEGPFYNKP